MAQRDHQISDLLAQLQNLKDSIRRLEEELRQAQQSGDQGVQNLRMQLQKLQEEFDQFKFKASKDFEQMQQELLTRAKKELDA